MKDILTAPFMAEMIRTTTNMYAHGWSCGAFTAFTARAGTSTRPSA